ncbi:hypothetical protein ABBQ38_014174 [Trebouxia sp. C0009 RCD-2024]
MPARERTKRKVPDNKHAQKFKNHPAAKSSKLILVVTLILAGVLSGQAYAVAVRAPVLAMADKPFERSLKLTTFTNVSHTVTQCNLLDAAVYDNCCAHQHAALLGHRTTDISLSFVEHAFRGNNGRKLWTPSDNPDQPRSLYSLVEGLQRWKDGYDCRQAEWRSSNTGSQVPIPHPPVIIDAADQDLQSVQVDQGTDNDTCPEIWPVNALVRTGILCSFNPLC